MAGTSASAPASAANGHGDVPPLSVSREELTTFTFPVLVNDGELDCRLEYAS